MKKVLITIGLTVLVAISAQAQVPTFASQTIVNDITVAAQTATNLFSIGNIDVSKQNSVGVCISASNTVDQSTSGAINGIMFVRSNDNTFYETNGGTYVTWVPQGKNWMTTFTNIPSYGAQYIRILYVTNAAASGGNNTNIGSIHITYGVKISSP